MLQPKGASDVSKKRVQLSSHYYKTNPDSVSNLQAISHSQSWCVEYQCATDSGAGNNNHDDIQKNITIASVRLLLYRGFINSFVKTSHLDLNSAFNKMDYFKAALQW